MRVFTTALTFFLLCCLLTTVTRTAETNDPSSSAPGPKLPYVYTQWKHFTVKDGLPNDHVFAVKVVDPKIWIGSEDGLACLDKRTGKIRSWQEKDGLPWRVVSAIDVDPKTGDLWLGLFGGGLARFSGGRFDHFHQLNSGLVNDVVYGVAVENDNVWAATTAGASRYNMVTGKWTIFTEKNAPMEEIWNYGACYSDGKVYLGIWGSGVLEFDVATQRWKDYLDPDGEMEIDLYRDDGIVHVITTGVSHVEGILWVSSYFGMCRYDGRHWRGYYAHETGLPSDFGNAVAGRSANEAWFCTDKGLGVVADFPSDTWVTYTRDQKTNRGKAVISRGKDVLAELDMQRCLPHNYVLWVDFDGNDAWVGTSKGLGWAIGSGYYKGLKTGGDQEEPRKSNRRSNHHSYRSEVNHEILSTTTVGCFLSVLPLRADPDPGKSSPTRPTLELDEDTRQVLQKINSGGPYQVPDLELKRDENYAHTSEDVVPFGHVEPYKKHFLDQMEYTGPGRAKPEPKDLKTVKLGFIGPIMSTVSVATGGKSHEEALGIKMLQGSRLAIEQANAKGGYLKRSIPFELVVSNDNGLWGASGNEIIKMAYKDKVWAILGTIDGANSHIAIRVALKAEIVMMNSGDTDPTFIETNIPWVFRCIGDDRQQGYLLVDYMYRKLGLKRVGIIRASNRYGRFGVREILDGSRRLGWPVPLEMAYDVGGRDFSLQLERLQMERVDAVVHWGDAADGARILKQMRALGMKQPYFACDRCLSGEFLEIAADHAEGVICTYPWNPTRQETKLNAFHEAFRKRFGEEPETYAAHGYDGMNMLIWAVQVTGLNRAKIRDVLAHRRKPWAGVTGEITFSAALDDLGAVFLAERENGAWKFYSREELDIPKGPLPRDPAVRPATQTTSR